MSEKSPVTRRTFLKTSGAAAAAVGVTASSYAKVVGANDRIRIGFIGAGGMGSGHMKAIAGLKEKNNLEAVAVADCWQTRAEQGKDKAGAQHAFTDYRKVIENRDIDYVTIATPEHWHSTMTIDALDAGKAVYCEKPMTHSIPQAQAVIKKVRRDGIAAAGGGAGNG